MKNQDNIILQGGKNNMKAKDVLLLFFLINIMYWGTACAEFLPTTNLQGFGFKIFRVESGLYPFVQIYMRTFDQNMNPLVNLNERNIGIMVQGRSYDWRKSQYRIFSIRNRNEPIRTVIVLDTSGSMAGNPFNNAKRAISRFIDGKRPQDQVAIIALADNAEGYELVSNFERNRVVLGNRLKDLKANVRKSRLYDAIGAAMQLGGSALVGGSNSKDITYTASTSIIVFSDGHDEGSAISRTDLMTRIAELEIPIPIYSLAYTKSSPKYLRNLQALSKNSFGKYYGINKTLEKMTRCVEDIQNIVQNDYVVTFRAYLPVDGELHNGKIGVEYPSNSGNIMYQSFKFEAIEPPPVEKIRNALIGWDRLIPPVKDGNPYVEGGASAYIPRGIKSKGVRK